MMLVYLLPQLPLYIPNDAEKADPKLYAANVRKELVRNACLSVQV